MKLTRPFLQRRRRARHSSEEIISSQAGGAQGGLPLYLAGKRNSHSRNFGAISMSLGDDEMTHDAVAEREETVELPGLSGAGAPSHAIAYSLTLQGRTDADFGSDFSTANARTARASDCDGCEGEDCVRATGVLVSQFHVTTTVTLPSVDDFPDLTPCQRQRVGSAITGVLAPHEQRHVTAFRTYNGTVRTAFNLKLCREDFAARIQSLHDGIEGARQASAQSRSDALDPFNFEVDLDCEDAPATAAPGATGHAGAPQQ